MPTLSSGSPRTDLMPRLTLGQSYCHSGWAARPRPMPTSSPRSTRRRRITTSRISSATYTDVAGTDLGVAVGGGSIPGNAQGVAVTGSREFGATIGRAMGFSSFESSADATAITGRLTGGAFLPVVIPVSIVDCETNGNLGGAQENAWTLSQPGTPPVGTEYIVPLCKTGGGSFQILDLDPGQRCDDEIANPPTISWPGDPRHRALGQRQQLCEAHRRLRECQPQGQGRPNPDLRQLAARSCGTSGGSHATYRIIKVAALVPGLHERHEQQEQPCMPKPRQRERSATPDDRRQRQQLAASPAGSCGDTFTSGPVGAGTVGNSDAIGVQLIK